MWLHDFAYWDTYDLTDLDVYAIGVIDCSLLILVFFYIYIMSNVQD